MEVFNVSEHWKSFADEIQDDEIIRGDCDDFSLTCGELLSRTGIKKDTIRIALCWTENNIYHAVCVCDGYVLDNRQRDIMPWNDLPYRWHKSMGLDEVGVWREIS